MRALILGGNGFIGSHLVDEVRRQGHGVRVFDRSPEQYRDPVEGVEYVFGDFGNRREVRDALEGVDLVYHLVGTSLPQSSSEDPASDVETSVLRTIALLEDCVAAGVGRILYVSSGGTVYGIPQAFPVARGQPDDADLLVWHHETVRGEVSRALPPPARARLRGRTSFERFRPPAGSPPCPGGY